MKDFPVQTKMFHEITDQEIFIQAQKYAIEYVKEVNHRHVYPTEDALKQLKIFDEELPEKTGSASEILELLDRFGSPTTVSTLGGRYFGFVTGGSIPIGLATKSLATYWDQNGAMQVMSPISAKLELVVERWLKQIFKLPDRTVVGFVSGTSSANFCGLAAARYRILKRMGWDINTQGFWGAPKIRIMTGKHAHSTVLKAISLLGFGTDNVDWVEVDDQGRIIVESLPKIDDKTIIILQAGNVNSGSFDNFRSICDIASKANAWVHIDGAFGLWAAASDTLRYLIDGIELANSLATDGHKTLNTPYDSGMIFCEDKEALVSALHMTGAYIVHGQDRDGMLYTPEMSRRSRIFELWAIIRYLGSSGIAEIIQNLHLRAKQFEIELERIEGITVLNDVVFNQVLVCCENDDLTTKLLEKIQEIRECWVGGSTWFEKKVIRISVSSWATTSDDVSISVKSFQKALDLVSRN